jgi:amidase
MGSILDRDNLGAFTRHTHATLPGAGSGSLAGLTFAAKDLFDIAGHRTGFGNPDWLRTHEPATRTAAAVQRVLDAGAEMVGRTHTDEMAWSLFGDNAHYGMPVNSAAAGRVTGGSSCGSASAVAGGLVDFALGSDTGGSVRFPASLCGLYGMRPTHGRVSLEGACPLAPSFDTVGWFTRDADLLERVGRVLLQDDAPTLRHGELLIAADAFEWAGEDASEALQRAIGAAEKVFGQARAVDIAPEGFGVWAEVFRDLQAAEAWASHGEWVDRVAPSFGPGVKERFAYARTVDPARVRSARALREEVRAGLGAMLEGGAVLILPTAPCIAPLRGSPQDLLNALRVRCVALLCGAGFIGAPQVSLPLGRLEGCPIGISLVAAPGSDTMLLDLARRIRAPIES